MLRRQLQLLKHGGRTLQSWSDQAAAERVEVICADGTAPLTSGLASTSVI